MLGSVLNDRYEILSTIGEGGMGEVFRARPLVPGSGPAAQTVAIKVLRAELLNDPDAVARFHREARAAAALRSPYVAKVFDFGETTDGRPFLVMEYLEGIDLMDEIDAKGALSHVEATRFVAQACVAMSEAHNLGIIHRDLKPSNLFLAMVDGVRTVKVLDFGISKVSRMGDQKLTSTSMSFGTPLYMSPEQIRSTKLVDERTDIWSLGVILYEALTGRPPFMAETPGGLAVAISVETYEPPSVLRPDLPRGLDEVVAGALQKNPKNRYASMLELLRALEDFAPDFDNRTTHRRVGSGTGAEMQAAKRVALNGTLIQAPPVLNAGDSSSETQSGGLRGVSQDSSSRLALPAWSKASPPPRRTPHLLTVLLAAAGVLGLLLIGGLGWLALNSSDPNARNNAADVPDTPKLAQEEPSASTIPPTATAASIVPPPAAESSDHRPSVASAEPSASAVRPGSATRIKASARTTTSTSTKQPSTKPSGVLIPPLP